MLTLRYIVRKEVIRIILIEMQKNNKQNTNGVRQYLDCGGGDDQDE